MVAARIAIATSTAAANCAAAAVAVAAAAAATAAAAAAASVTTNTYYYRNHYSFISTQPRLPNPNPKTTPIFNYDSSSRSISSSGRRCPDVTAKLFPVLCHSACRCHRTERIRDVFLPYLSWLSSASFPGYHSLHYCLL